MVTDARGHEVPADSDMWGYREDMGLLSESIADVRSVANQAAAQSAVAELEAGDVDPAGTVWWFVSPGGLYVYDGDAFLELAQQARVDAVTGRLPDATAIGTTVLTGTGGQARTKTVTLPAGRFSATPYVTATAATALSSSSSYQYIWATAPTTTSFVLGVMRSTSTDVRMYWHAIQQDATAELARAEVATTTDVIVTCPSHGCDNRGVPIEIASSWTDEDGVEHPVTAVECGVCGTDITDTMQPIEGS